MTTAREIMTEGAECVRTDQNMLDAARLMGELGVGALPICGPDNKVKGVVTDRDIVVKVIGQGKDLNHPAGSLNQNEAVTVGADDDIREVLQTMTRHQVRRLPVIDAGRLVGMIAVADVASALPESDTGALVAALSAE